MATPLNLRDANIFMDFTVWIDDVGRIGQCPSFQPPDIQIAVEEFRGGGMDGPVEIPFGVEKIDFEFDMHTWDNDVWQYLGYGPGSMNVPITFRGHLMTPEGVEKSVLIQTKSLIKSIKTNKVEAGKKVDMTIMLNCNFYSHDIDGVNVCTISLFEKIFVLNGVDRMAGARANLGFSY